MEFVQMDKGISNIKLMRIFRFFVIIKIISFLHLKEILGV